MKKFIFYLLLASIANAKTSDIVKRAALIIDGFFNQVAEIEKQNSSRSQILEVLKDQKNISRFDDEASRKIGQALAFSNCYEIKFYIPNSLEREQIRQTTDNLLSEVQVRQNRRKRLAEANRRRKNQRTPSAKKSCSTFSIPVFIPRS